MRPPGGPDSGTDRRRSAGPDPLGRSEAPARTHRRAGATRADLVRPDTAGATALQPSAPPVPEPDEVTDTGARRARSTFRVADAPAPGTGAGYDDEDFAEPSLVLQWGIFLAQTLTGAAVGLGVWLAFYRLWSTWPFYAAPAVGATLVLMLVAARTLRRRYGHELDLVTAVVTISVGTVLTVLPAAFTLQSVA